MINRLPAAYGRRWGAAAAFVLAAATVCNSHSQEVVTEERLGKLAQQIEDLQDSQRVARSEVARLEREIELLRSDVNTPTQTYADRGQFNHLLKAAQEMEQKQIRDSQRTQLQLGALRNLLSQLSLAGGDSGRMAESSSSKETLRHKTRAEYVIRTGDTLRAIIRSYRTKGTEFTLEDILAANPGLDPGRLRPGQRIRIPSPSR